MKMPISPIAICLASVLLLSSCSEEQPRVSQISDFSIYLTKMESEENPSLEFWQKRFEDNPDNHVFKERFANELQEAAKKAYDMDQLAEARMLLEEVHERFPESVSTLHSLAANATFRHAFKEAQYYAEAAFETGEEEYQCRLVLADVYLEQGWTSAAEDLLKPLDGKERFDYAIRQMKIQDAKDDLDAAIHTMEGALRQTEQMNNKQLIVWSYANLGDMYGHQGDIDKSYSAYLKALQHDASCEHALKGIGWIAYSHDRDYKLALDIWSGLEKRTADPELQLLLIELDEHLSNTHRSLERRQEFIDDFLSSPFETMYASALIPMLIDEHAPDALRLAKADVQQRQHPVAQSYLALALSANDRIEEAKELIENKVLGQTGEPAALMNAAQVYKMAGMHEELDAILPAIEESAYELGPAVMKELISAIPSKDWCTCLFT